MFSFKTFKFTEAEPRLAVHLPRGSLVKPINIMRTSTGRYVGYSYVAARWDGRVLKIYTGLHSGSPLPPTMQYSGICPSEGVMQMILATIIATLMPDTMPGNQAYLEGMKLAIAETEIPKGIPS